MPLESLLDAAALIASRADSLSKRNQCTLGYRQKRGHRGRKSPYQRPRAVGTRIGDALQSQRHRTRDHWSRPEDLEALKRDLTNAKAAFRSIPDGTHFPFLDRPELGRSAFLQLILDFLK